MEGMSDIYTTAKRAARRANFEYFKFYSRFRGSPGYHPQGVDMMEEDWDNLIVLDACRYDMFAETVDIPGTLRSVTSRGSCTGQWIRGNFVGRDLHDTVYVTASPILYERDFSDVSFHAVNNVWSEDGWDPEHKTVLPETVEDHAREVEEEYPNKRLIIHFLQPHMPFIPAPDEMKTHTQRIHRIHAARSEGSLNFWERIFRGSLDFGREEVWKYYVKNLEVAIPNLERLVNDLRGKTVITSDHGNMVGERSWPLPVQTWGHPLYHYTEELVNVPWLECTHSDRKEIVSEPAVSDSDTEIDEAEVKEKLEQLGYT